MNENEFLSKLRKLKLGYRMFNIQLPEKTEGIKIPIYYTIDDKQNVLIDFESMREEFENKLNKISDLLEGDKDE